MSLQRSLELIWLVMPAYCANMAPPFVKYWRGWNRPIHRKWLGDHKTVMGFGFGVLVGVVMAFVQSHVAFPSPLWRPELWPVLGLVLGAGAMCGDSAKSLIKRRIGIAPGHSWIPADQLDFMIGALIPLQFIVPLLPSEIVLLLIFTFAADIAVNHASFYLGIRDTKW